MACWTQWKFPFQAALFSSLPAGSPRGPSGDNVGLAHLVVCDGGASGGGGWRGAPGAPPPPASGPYRWEGPLWARLTLARPSSPSRSLTLTLSPLSPPHGGLPLCPSIGVPLLGFHLFAGSWWPPVGGVSIHPSAPPLSPHTPMVTPPIETAHMHTAPPSLLLRPYPPTHCYFQGENFQRFFFKDF